MFKPEDYLPEGGKDELVWFRLSDGLAAVAFRPSQLRSDPLLRNVLESWTSEGQFSFERVSAGDLGKDLLAQAGRKPHLILYRWDDKHRGFLPTGGKL